MLKNGQANKEKNIRAGFAVCGIYPLNIQRVLSRLPPERTAVQNEMSAQLTEELKKSRYGDPEKATRAKKANRLPPGVSYTVSAIPEGEPVAGPSGVTSEGRGGNSSGRGRGRGHRGGHGKGGFRF
jgi:hypothetical protein